jgi:nitric oxide reductase activation protein
MINYRVESFVSGANAQSKIYMDSENQGLQEFALLVLLDLSESMNDVMPAESRRLLELTLDATVVLSSVLERLGHAYGIYGFNSKGRHQVNIMNLKDFDEPFEALNCLEAIQGAYSTRLGAGLRHAYAKISQRQERHKLVLVITDGQPSDIDVYDPQYLIEDARRVVNEMESVGCKTFCLSLDKSGDAYTHKIFRK